MFRVVAFYNPTEKDGRAYRQDLAPFMRSSALPTFNHADAMLNTLVDSGLFQGGHIEEHIDGIGWTLAENK